MEKVNAIKALFITLGAYLSDKLGILGPILLMLVAVLITDYVTGLLDDKKHKELSSWIGTWGTVKIPISTFFGSFDSYMVDYKWIDIY